ncbi:MAG: HEAT repeat domain-containing protein [Thermoguttaceae bacterium]|jgi:HEAT repeat protein
MEEHVLDTKETIAYFRAALKHANVSVRALAAKQLGELGPSAKEALPELTMLLQDEEQLVRDAAEEAIKRIG